MMDDERQIQAYIFGRLSADDEQDFEAAYFADDALAAELEQAIEIRAATRGGASGAAASGRPPKTWFSFAAAAAVALVAFGMIQYLVPLEPDSDTGVMRGGAGDFPVDVVTDGGAITASWASVAGATEYRIDLYRMDGTLLAKQQTSETSVRIDRHPEARFLRVSGHDELGKALADSGLLALDEYR